jgi:uncharacterized damage-inducible protein DinB
MDSTDCATTDRAAILLKLQEGHQELLASVEGLSDADATVCPDANHWSVIGIIEHLAIVESNLLRNIKAANPIDGEPPPSRDAVMFERVKGRATKVQAPPQVHPRNECATLAEALQRFQSARLQTLDFLAAHEGNLRRCTTVHPLVGPLTGWECLHMMAAHPFRHAAQIRELRELKADR